MNEQSLQGNEHPMVLERNLNELTVKGIVNDLAIRSSDTVSVMLHAGSNRRKNQEVAQQILQHIGKISDATRQLILRMDYDEVCNTDFAIGRFPADINTDSQEQLRMFALEHFPGFAALNFDGVNIYPVLQTTCNSAVEVQDCIESPPDAPVPASNVLIIPVHNKNLQGRDLDTLNIVVPRTVQRVESGLMNIVVPKTTAVIYNPQPVTTLEKVTEYVSRKLNQFSFKFVDNEDGTRRLSTWEGITGAIYGLIQVGKWQLCDHQGIMRILSQFRTPARYLREKKERIAHKYVDPQRTTWVDKAHYQNRT